jgi:hypothetical protein
MASRPKEYTPLPSSSLSRKDVLAVNAVASEIESSGEALTRKSVLDRARPKGSPIHHLFDWDDESAAEAWRLERAGQLISAVYEFKVETKESVREFHSVLVASDDGPSRRYERKKSVLRSRAKMGQIEVALLRTIGAAIRTARGLGLTETPRWKNLERAFLAVDPPGMG